MGWTGEPPPFFPTEHSAEDRDQLSVIIPEKLYLTNFRGAENVDELKRIKCTHIAAVGAEFMHNEENHAAHALKVRFWNKDITDDDDQADQMATSLRDAAAFIKMAIAPPPKAKRSMTPRKRRAAREGCCVVHCAAGISRSSTVVLGYLVLHCGKSLREAFGLLYASRSCIWPNEGFMSALIALEREVRGEPTSLSLAEYERWGDYDGPDEPDDDPHHHGRTREKRQAAAVAATEEAVHCHELASSLTPRSRQMRYRRSRFTGVLRWLGVQSRASSRERGVSSRSWLLRPKTASVSPASAPAG
jgi:predicted protein tyrosine phosphatase